MEPVANPLPVRLGHPHGRLFQGSASLGAKTVIRHLAARHADEGKSLRQKPRRLEIANGRQQQAGCEISGTAEDDEDTGIRSSTHGFGSTWPPKLWRIADRSLSATLSFSRD